MAKYVAKPVEVEAIQITGLKKTEGGIECSLSDGSAGMASSKMYQGLEPAIGDYWVEPSNSSPFIVAKDQFEAFHIPVKEA